MTTDDLKAWLLLAGFKTGFNRYFYLHSGFSKIIVVNILVSGAVEVRIYAEITKFINCSEAQQYIQTLIGE